MKDFQVAGPVNLADVDLQEEIALQQPEDENNIERWKRIARLAVLTSAEHRWSQVRKISTYYFVKEKRYRVAKLINFSL